MARTAGVGVVIAGRYQLVGGVKARSLFGYEWEFADQQLNGQRVRGVMLELAHESLRKTDQFRGLIDRWQHLTACSNVARLHDGGIWEGWLYLVFPTNPTTTLHAWLNAEPRRGGQLPLREVQHITNGVLCALESAHALVPEPLFHDGLSSHSVLVTAGSNASPDIVVTDFGLVHLEALVRVDTSQDRQRLVHLAPEQERPPYHPVPQSDIFQAARIVVECLSGSAEPPATMNTSWSRFTETGSTQVASELQAIRSDLSPQLCNVLASALQRTPSVRPRDIGAFRRELLLAMDTCIAAAAAPGGTPRKASTTPSTLSQRDFRVPRAPVGDGTTTVRAGALAGRYRLDSSVHDEGRATCFLAFDLRVCSLVHVIALPTGADPQEAKLFHGSWRRNNLCRVNQASMLQVLDLDEDRGTRRPFVVTEVLRGDHLDALVAKHGAQLPMFATAFAVQFGAVIDELFSQKVFVFDLHLGRFQFVAPGADQIKLRSIGAPPDGVRPRNGAVELASCVHHLLAGAPLPAFSDQFEHLPKQKAAWLRFQVSTLPTHSNFDRDRYLRWLEHCFMPSPGGGFTRAVEAAMALQSVLVETGTPHASPRDTPMAAMQPVDDAISISIESLEEVVTTYELGRHKKPIRALSSSKDGAIVVSAGLDGVLMLWDVGKRCKLRELLGHDGSIYTTALTLDGARLISGGQDWSLCVWDLASNRREPTVLVGHESFVSSTALSHDGRYAATCGADRRLCYWDLSPDQERLLWVKTVGDMSASCLAMTGDGRFIAVGMGDGAVRLWDNAGNLVCECSELREAVHSITASWDGATVFAGDETGMVVRWDVRQNVGQVFKAHGTCVRAMALAHSANRLVTASWDPNVKIWDLASGSCVAVMDQQDVAIWAVATDAAANWVVYGDSNGLVRLWTQDAALLGAV